MSDVFQISLSALNAFQKAIAVTGNNIANANTTGYSRQQVVLGTREPSAFGNGFVGNGVDVTTVTRNYDQFAVGSLRTASSTLGRLDAYKQYADQIDNVVGDRQTGISSALQDFFNAASDVANDPSSFSARQLLLSQAQSVSSRFSQAAGRLQSLSSDINQRVGADVQEINNIATSIASLNEQIVLESQSVGNQPPNDLLDTRDQLLARLSQLTAVSVTEDSDRAINVFIGSGQSLVLRQRTVALAVGQNQFDATKPEIIYTGNGGGVITASMTGGELGGLLDVRTQLIDPVRNDLGRIAAALAEAVNAQQHAGLDQTGALGQDIFSQSTPRVQANTANTGSETVSASITDVNQLTNDDYVLELNGAAYSLRRVRDGVTVPTTGSGTAVDPLVANGVAIVVTGTATSGDKFLIRPTFNVASSLRAVVSDPRLVAAAAPVRTGSVAGNAGSAQISAGEVLDAANPNLQVTAVIQFTSPTTFTINGSGSFLYTAGANIDANGWRVQISGTPAAGDSFQVERNAAGTGDNRNALLLAGLQSRAILGGGTATLNDSIGALIGRVGTEARQTDIARTAQAAVTDSAKQQVESISGVNLDDEAADLLRWQQAYQAAAQSIAIANTLFQSLLQLVR